MPRGGKTPLRHCHGCDVCCSGSMLERGPGRGSHGSGLGSQVSGLGSQVSGVRYRVSGIGCQVSGVRYRGFCSDRFGGVVQRVRFAGGMMGHRVASDRSLVCFRPTFIRSGPGIVRRSQSFLNCIFQRLFRVCHHRMRNNCLRIAAKEKWIHQESSVGVRSLHLRRL